MGMVQVLIAGAIGTPTDLSPSFEAGGGRRGALCKIMSPSPPDAAQQLTR